MVAMATARMWYVWQQGHLQRWENLQLHGWEDCASSFLPRYLDQWQLAERQTRGNLQQEVSNTEIIRRNFFYLKCFIIFYILCYSPK